jgi:hypothetical protein
MMPLPAGAALGRELGEVGYREGPSNANKFTDFISGGSIKGQFWCADFIVWTLVKSDVEIVRSSWTPYLEAWFRSKGRLHTTPRPGDVFFVYFPTLRRVAHTGFVTGVSADGRTVYTVEGNGNAAGGRNGYGVVRRARPAYAGIGRAGIRSYGRPAYGPAQPPKRRSTKPGSPVKAIQRALHFKDAWVDGEWGPKTDHALQLLRYAALGRIPHDVEATQRVAGTKVDGAWGRKSRSATLRTTARIQAALGCAPDGDWGPITESAFRTARRAYYRS